MFRHPDIVDAHLQALAIAYPLSVSEDCRWVVAHNFKLPPGYNALYTDVLFQIPSGYPCSPPGVGQSLVYLPQGLRYQGRVLRDLHEEVTPSWGKWAWFCYQWIRWNPRRDDLIGLLEMVRADLTDPPTH